MKLRIRALLLTAVLTMGILLSSCGGSGMSEDEIRQIYRDLVQQSYELNDIYYGDGLPFVISESIRAYKICHQLGWGLG